MGPTVFGVKSQRLLPFLAFMIAVNLAPAVLPTISNDRPPPPGVTLTAVGDLVMHMPVVNSAFSVEAQSYDFRPVFREIEPELRAANLTVGVLETSLTDNQQQLSGYPRFNTPVKLAAALRWSGFDLVFTAHNHSLDQGIDGICRTLSHLEAVGLPATGTRSNSRQKPYYIMEINGLKLAFFSYTTLTNGLTLPPGKRWALNTFNYNKIGWEILQLKDAGVDGIIMALHTGDEYVRYPSPVDQHLYRSLCALGVDVILGSHVHVIRPLERVIIKDPFRNYPKSCFVAYSLGNFLSNQRWRYSDCGLMITLHLRKRLWPPGLEIELLRCSPLWVKKDYEGYRILQVPPGEKTMTTATVSGPVSLQKKLREVWSDTEEVLVEWPGGVKQMQPPFF